jgi:hypothetical protein
MELIAGRDLIVYAEAAESNTFLVKKVTAYLYSLAKVIARASTQILDDMFGTKDALTTTEFAQAYKDKPILHSPQAIRSYLQEIMRKIPPSEVFKNSAAAFKASFGIKGSQP